MTDPSLTLPRPLLRRRPSRPLLALLAAIIAVLAVTAAPTARADALGISPPGANDWDCVPSAEHPEPVVLVNGTFETMAKNWWTLAPVLADAGYCVYAFDYGVTHVVPATGPVRDSATELGDFVDRVLEATDAQKVDLVGHSQGGMMPRWYIGFQGGAEKVDDLVGIAPSSHGTQGLIVRDDDGEGTALAHADQGVAYKTCAACIDQQAGSAFMQELASIPDTVPGVDYTVISTTHDEIVTPYTSQALDGPEDQVTNLVLQDLCPRDPFAHDQSPNDPVVHQIVLDALDHDGPASKDVSPTC